jgi:hypothetical protein
MEYAVNIYGEVEVCNDQFVKHVGYKTHTDDTFHTKSNISRISLKVTEILTGLLKNKKIIVPDKTICSVMSAVYQNFIVETGDIHSRHILPQEAHLDRIEKMTRQVIHIITTDVRNNLEIEDTNSKLSVWTTLLGDFNDHGMQSHSKIKLREKRPMPMQFHMKY